MVGSKSEHDVLILVEVHRMMKPVLGKYTPRRIKILPIHKSPFCITTFNDAPPESRKIRIRLDVSNNLNVSKTF